MIFADLSWSTIPWILGPILCPLLMALTALLGGPRTHVVAGLLGTMGVFVSVIGLTLTILERGPQELVIGGWKPPLGITLRADGLTAAMLIMSSVVGGMASCFALRYFADRQHYFWPLWLLLASALHGLFLASDVFNLYVTLELLSLTSVALVSLAGGPAIMASLRYLLASLLASMAYLLGVAILYAEYAALDLAILTERLEVGWPSGVGVSLILVSLLLKTALFPLHFWLPPAHASAPAPVSALLSALVVKASFYLILRLWYGTFAVMVSGAAEQMLALLGMGAILWGSVQAMRQTRLKLLIAYSTVAQLGYLFLAFKLIRYSPVDETIWKGIILFAVSHAFAKGAVFLAAGSIQFACGHDTIADLRGTGDRLAIPFMTIGLAATALMGLPPSGAFMAKWLLLQESLRRGEFVMAVVIVAGGLMAAVYSFRILQNAFDEPRTGLDCRSLSPWMLWPPLVLSLLAAVLGLATYPFGQLLEHGIPTFPSDTHAAGFVDLEDLP